MNGQPRMLQSELAAVFRQAVGVFLMQVVEEALGDLFDHLICIKSQCAPSLPAVSMIGRSANRLDS
jgi:hypothetical protein